MQYLLLILQVSGAAAASERVALVIGNTGYRHVDVLPVLPNATNDARDLAALFEANGFHVIRRVDADLEETRRSVQEFLQRSRHAEAAFFYFAGHGIESESLADNFLLPVDAEASDVSSLATEALSLGDLIEDIEKLSEGPQRANRNGPVRLILLDCCRESIPGQPDIGDAPFRFGLRAIEAQKIDGGTMVIFASSPGTIAFDRWLTDDSNSPFARALLEELDPTRGQRSLYVSLVEAEDKVEEMTGGEQVPKRFFSGSSPPFHRFHLGAGRLGAGASKSVAVIRGDEAGQVRLFTGPGDVPFTFRWCPPGTFLMGSPESEEGRQDNERQVKVTLSRGFWMGETEVTQEQWKSLTGQGIDDLGYLAEGIIGMAMPGRSPQHPAYYLNWNQARDFARALTTHLHDSGQLPTDWVVMVPTEAQWEYACRAGGTLPFGEGIADSRSLTHRDAAFSWEHAYGAPPYPRSKGYLDDMAGVREFPANAWGLFGMHGNATEWVADAYQDLLPGGRDPFVAGKTGASRILRGGDFESHGEICRSSYRSDVLPPDTASMTASVRLAIVPAESALDLAGGTIPGDRKRDFASIWDHNGSEVGLVVNGNRRTFLYNRVREGLQNLVKPGDTLFEGTVEGGTYTGRARRFAEGCPPVEYESRGAILENGSVVELIGDAPVRGRDCRPVRYEVETLRFRYLRKPR